MKSPAPQTHNEEVTTMASIADARHPARRWSLLALLRKVQARPRPISAVQTAVVETLEPRKRRSYAPPRDAFLENSSMRREMYRL